MTQPTIATKSVEATNITPFPAAKYPTGKEEALLRRAADTVASVARRCGFVAWSFVTWPFDFFCSFYGVEDLDGKILVASILDRHRVERCRLRCGAVHDPGEICSLQMVGDCSSCGHTVKLDYYGNCSRSGQRYRYHPITNRRSHPAARRTTTRGGDGHMTK